MEEHYVVDDQVLPILELPNPCEIRIDITDTQINLQIGQRDWQLIRGHPDSGSAGTFIGGTPK